MQHFRANHFRDIGTNKERGIKLTKKQTKKFFDLFMVIAKKKGGKMAARKHIRIAGGVYEDLKHGRISLSEAKKILNSYNKIKGSLNA